MFFEIYKSGLIRKNWKWRLRSNNHKILASGRGFNNKYSCIKSIKLIKNYINNSKIYVKNRKNQEWELYKK